MRVTPLLSAGAWLLLPAATHAQEADTATVANKAETTDDIFRRVFGRPPPPLPPSSYPVLMGGIRLGNFQIQPPNGADSGTIEARFVSQALAPNLASEIQTRALALAQDKDRLSFDDIRQLGIGLDFDRTTLALKVDLPTSLRATQILNMRQTIRPSDAYELLKPAHFSAYATLQAGTALVEQSRQTRKGFTETAADLQLAVNWGGFVAESKLVYDEARTHSLSRENTRISYDDTRRLIRYEAGDLNARRTALQGSPRIAGFSAYRNFSIDPYKITRPIATQSFELTRPGRVQVYVNGAFLREFSLQEGRYLLRDLPLASSAGNDVELRIVYGSGQTEVLRFPAFFDFELLEKGLLDFSVSGGVPYRDDSGLRHYDMDRHAGSAFFRYGLTQQLTVGANWQGNDRLDLVGTDVTWASGIGTFRLQTAANARNLAPRTSQVSLAYRWLGTDRERNRSLDLSLVYTGRDFKLLDALFPDNRTTWQGRLRYGQDLDGYSRIQLSGSYDRNRHSFRDSYGVSANYSRQLSIGAISLGAEYRRDEDRSGIVARVGLTVPLGRNTISTDYNSDDHNFRLQYSRTPDQSVGGIGMSAGLERRTGSNSAFGGVNYLGNRFAAEVQQIAQGYLGDERMRDMRTRFWGASSLVFADGEFGLSRPVYNSFALFKLNERAGKYRIAVDPRTDFGSSKVKYGAKSGALGPAVLPDLTSYYVRPVQVDAPDAPAGSATGGAVYTLRPGYRGGYAVIVGSEASVSVLGRLVDQSGAPIALAAGQATDLDAPDTYAPSVIFTNATGRFFVEKLVAGHRYEAILNANGRSVRFRFEVPPDAEGVFRIDTPIRVDAEPAKEP